MLNYPFKVHDKRPQLRIFKITNDPDQIIIIDRYEVLARARETVTGAMQTEEKGGGGRWRRGRRRRRFLRTSPVPPREAARSGTRAGASSNQLEPLRISDAHTLSSDLSHYIA